MMDADNLGALACQKDQRREVRIHSHLKLVKGHCCLTSYHSTVNVIYSQKRTRWKVVTTLADLTHRKANESQDQLRPPHI